MGIEPLMSPSVSGPSELTFSFVQELGLPGNEVQAMYTMEGASRPPLVLQSSPRICDVVLQWDQM